MDTGEIYFTCSGLLITLLASVFKLTSWPCGTGITRTKGVMLVGGKFDMCVVLHVGHLLCSWKVEKNEGRFRDLRSSCRNSPAHSCRPMESILSGGRHMLSAITRFTKSNCCMVADLSMVPKRLDRFCSWGVNPGRKELRSPTLWNTCTVAIA